MKEKALSVPGAGTDGAFLQENYGDSIFCKNLSDNPYGRSYLRT